MIYIYKITREFNKLYCANVMLCYVMLWYAMLH